ncbi:MAG: thiosulfate sulfurtransferase [Rhodospirillales bacterium]|nr:thiosulfate sulfurtransferase [Rhodospirillales bacterium]
MTLARISPAALHALIEAPARQEGAELAILDAREEGEFGTAHLFWAVPCPLSQCEWRAPALLPGKAARIVCVDDGRGLAERLAAFLLGQGYTDVAVLEGGTPAWAAAGYVLFSGVNVPSKAFGEWVEHQYGTESVDAPELKSWIEAGRDMVVLDSRTAEEFHRMSIPTGISVPGGELAYRIGDLAPDPATLVVVNCAGRTRSIMGAESLRRAGIPNKVVALRNGTMGWELAGFRCDRGRLERFTPTRPASLTLARERAERFATAAGVRVIDAAQCAALAADPARTLYLLDVRDPAEYRAGHHARAVNAPGGQLVQATDQWVAVRGARIVLTDDTGVRARMAAAWLRQMGHRDVFVVPGLIAGGEAPARPAPPDAAGIDVLGLAHLLDSGIATAIVDLARSIVFRDGHIPGAVWGVRSRLARLAPALAGAEEVVITSPDGMAARYAVPEIAALTKARVRVLEGGTAAWHDFGRPLNRDRTDPPDQDCIDFYLRPYDRNTGIEEAMAAYLSWEIDLVHEIARDGTVHFGPALIEAAHS